jgi:hypothetical protein
MTVHGAVFQFAQAVPPLRIKNHKIITYSVHVTRLNQNRVIFYIFSLSLHKILIYVCFVRATISINSSAKAEQAAVLNNKTHARKARARMHTHAQAP